MEYSFNLESIDVSIISVCHSHTQSGHVEKMPFCTTFKVNVSWHMGLLFEISLIRETKGNIYVFALHTIAVIYFILSFYITYILNFNTKLEFYTYLHHTARIYMILS